MRLSEVATEEEEEKNISEDFDLASSFHVCSILQPVFTRVGQTSWVFSKEHWRNVIGLTHLTIRMCFSVSSRKEWNSLCLSDFISLTRPFSSDNNVKLFVSPVLSINQSWFNYSKNRKRKWNCNTLRLSEKLGFITRCIKKNLIQIFCKRFLNHLILQKTQEQGYFKLKINEFLNIPLSFFKSNSMLIIIFSDL